MSERPCHNNRPWGRVCRASPPLTCMCGVQGIPQAHHHEGRGAIPGALFPGLGKNILVDLDMELQETRGLRVYSQASEDAYAIMRFGPYRTPHTLPRTRRKARLNEAAIATSAAATAAGGPLPSPWSLRAGSEAKTVWSRAVGCVGIMTCDRIMGYGEMCSVGWVQGGTGNNNKGENGTRTVQIETHLQLPQPHGCRCGRRKPPPSSAQSHPTRSPAMAARRRKEV